jgi:head-tail adaptor
MMNHLVRIDRRVNSQDPTSGAITETWTTYLAAVPCEIKPLSVSAYIQSRAQQSDISVRVKFPYIDGLDDTMRFVGLCECHLGKVYNPDGILEDDITGRQHITVPCSQGVNEGA